MHRSHRTRAALAALFAIVVLGIAPGGALANRVDVNGPPTAVSMHHGHLSVFARGSDGALWSRMYRNGHWESWQSLGGVILGQPSAVSFGRGHMDVFVRGADNKLHHRHFQSSDTSHPYYDRWNAWETLGDFQMKGDPVAVRPRPGHIEVFARGMDDALIGKPYVDCCGWVGWNHYGGVLSADPSAVTWNSGHMDVFVRGSDLTLWHRWWNGSSWSGWGKLGARQMHSEPAAVSWGHGHIEVFSRSSAGEPIRLPLASACGGWCADFIGMGGWTDVQPQPMSWGDPESNARVDGQHIDVFYRGSNVSLWHRYFLGGSGWSGESKLSPDWQLVTEPVPSSYGNGHIATFAQSNYGELGMWWYGPGWPNGWQSLGRPVDNDLRFGVAQNSDPGTIGSDGRVYNMFTDEWYRRLRTRMYRFTVPWNAMDQGPDGQQANRIRGILQAAKANGDPEVMITIDRASGEPQNSFAPTRAYYEAEIARLVPFVDGLANDGTNRYARVRWWGPANEPNLWLGTDPSVQQNSSEPDTRAQLVASYYNSLRKYTGDGRIIGPDFLDDYDSNTNRVQMSPVPNESTIGRWVRMYKEAGGGFGAAAPFHNYGGIQRKSIESVTDYQNAVGGSTPIWLTETGAFMNRTDRKTGNVLIDNGPAGQDDRLRWWMARGLSSLPRVTRMYYYHMREPTTLAALYWDTGLQDVNGARRPSWWTYCTYVGGNC